MHDTETLMDREAWWATDIFVLSRTIPLNHYMCLIMHMENTNKVGKRLVVNKTLAGNFIKKKQHIV